MMCNAQHMLHIAEPRNNIRRSGEKSRILLPKPRHQAAWTRRMLNQSCFEEVVVANAALTRFGDDAVSAGLAYSELRSDSPILSAIAQTSFPYFA